jgi:hypothetical protein
VEEARRVLARLERIDRLERLLLVELEVLVCEAERWVAAEGPGAEAAAAALQRCRAALRSA